MKLPKGINEVDMYVCVCATHCTHTQTLVSAISSVFMVGKRPNIGKTNININAGYQGVSTHKWPIYWVPTIILALCEVL